MRLPLWAVLVMALLAGYAHAQSSETLSSQGKPLAGAVNGQSSGHPYLADSPASGGASLEGATSGKAGTAQPGLDRQPRSIEFFDQALATTERQLNQIWGFLGGRNWIPVLLTFFNGLVAVFAYWLWKCTRGLIGLGREQTRDLKEMIAVAREAADAAKRSAEAASLQARAMIGTELPRLELGQVQLAYSDQSVRQALKAPSVDLRFNNYGRTTALVSEKCIEVRLGQALPPEPAYDLVEALPVAEAVESGGSVGAGALRRLGELSENQVDALLEGRTNIWVYGFVRFSDFLGMEHKRGFCLRWAPPRREASTGGSFVQESPGAYVYQTDDWPLGPVENERLPSARDYRLAAE